MAVHQRLFRPACGVAPASAGTRGGCEGAPGEAALRGGDAGRSTNCSLDLHSVSFCYESLPRFSQSVFLLGRGRGPDARHSSRAATTRGRWQRRSAPGASSTNSVMYSNASGKAEAAVTPAQFTTCVMPRPTRSARLCATVTCSRRARGGRRRAPRAGIRNGKGVDVRAPSTKISF